jgi:hypothetical protein
VETSSNLKAINPVRRLFNENLASTPRGLETKSVLAFSNPIKMAPKDSSTIPLVTAIGNTAEDDLEIPADTTELLKSLEELYPGTKSIPNMNFEEIEYCPNYDGSQSLQEGTCARA